MPTLAITRASLLAALLLMSGCGGDDDGSSGDTSTPEETRAPETETADAPQPDETALEGTIVLVRTDAPVAEVSPRYLSFSIDSSTIRWGYDFDRPRLKRLTEALGPAYLRLGGTVSDTIFYDLSADPVAEPPEPFVAVLDRAYWDAACAFATELDLPILFTLNVGPGPRDPETGRWDPSNARTLIEYTRSIDCPVEIWELGNEINGFPLAHGFVLDGVGYAADIGIARALIDDADPDALLAGPAQIYWPVLGELGIALMQEFLTNAGALVDIVSWHYYPMQSSDCPFTTRDASLDALFDPANLDEIHTWAEEVETLSELHAPSAEVWLDETGHALCGGETGLSDRFVTGFWWLDQLALIARRGQPVVVRQALTGGQYHLIDRTTLEPSADYWNSLLWKRLMGTRVLAAEADGGGPLLRVYSHCTPGRPGAVTVLAINLDRVNEVTLAIPGLGGDPELYLVTGPDLEAKEVWLNGTALVAAEDGSPPPIEPIEPVTSTPSIELAPRSYAFVVLPGAEAEACR